MGWLITLIANLASMVGIALTKKTLLATAAITASIALTVALSAAIQTLLATIITAVPAEFVASAYFIPSNTSACIAAVIGAKFARFVYDWNLKNLQIASSIN